MGHEMRFHHERSSLAPRQDDAAGMVFPLESSVVEITTHRIDRTAVAVVPAKLRYSPTSLSPITNVLTIFIDAEAMKGAEKEYRPHIELASFDEWLRTPRVLPRTRWLDELAHRFVFEREVCEKHTSQAARFLATEITKELYFACKEHVAAEHRASVAYEGSDLVHRARSFIEANLFAAESLAALARHCATSESTLLREFKREVGVTPIAYLRDRRLDESLILLQSGRFAVGEVATRVGYASLAAFTAAFGRKFGQPPSQRAAVQAPTLPPHGAPPKPKKKRRRSSHKR
jgi:AraC-like DNA-binding protein